MSQQAHGWVPRASTGPAALASGRRIGATSWPQGAPAPVSTREPGRPMYRETHRATATGVLGGAAIAVLWHLVIGLLAVDGRSWLWVMAAASLIAGGAAAILARYGDRGAAAGVAAVSGTAFAMVGLVVELEYMVGGDWILWLSRCKPDRLRLNRDNRDGTNRSVARTDTHARRGWTLSYFAVAATRADDRWSATEVDLDAVEDVEDAADVLRDAAPEAQVSVLFVEAADEYLTILRLDAGDDLRAFCSDAEYAAESRLGDALVADLDNEAVDETDDDSGVVSELEAEPVGEADLLADLGVPAPVLLSLCAKDGLLPADITSEIAGTLGCLDAIEELRDV